MSRATPRMREFAGRLIAHEARDNSAGTSGAFAVCEKLRPQLATLMGNAGFRALLSRALVLAYAEVGWLRGVQVKADGSVEDLEALATQVDPDEMARGRVVLVSQLLGLLVAFIGEDLTLRLVGEVWPELPLNDLNSVNGGKHEDPK